MQVDLNSLIGRLNNVTRRSLEAAGGLCVSRTNYDVEIEHWLLKLLEQTDTDLPRVLRQFEIDQSRLERDLTRAIDALKTGNSRRPALSPKLVELIREAWMFASVEHSAGAVRSGHLLVALLDNESLHRLIRDSVPELDRIDLAALRKDFVEITAGSSEDAGPSYAAESAAGELPHGRGVGAIGKSVALDQYTINLTQRALDGKMDPVLGRDFEIRQMIDILMRRRQNNPLLTGEAGVGKTAVAEGFALRIAAGDVPPPLRNVVLRTLDLGLLQAGAGMKGEFENRLKSVINEVKASPRPVILFIDEAHTLIGAGGSAGGSDAANLLKPALARGELRTIAATTWSEYKKYFEKDAALARRFQLVKVEEPSEQLAVLMLRGLISVMEKHHGLEILDEALHDAVRLSSRYLTGRQLPDKAVSVLETACARVAVGHAAVPAAVEDLRRRVADLELQEQILRREMATGEDHTARLETIASQRQEVVTELAELEARWEKESQLVKEIREVRHQLAEHAAASAVAAEQRSAEQQAQALSEKQLAAEQARLKELQAPLVELQGESPLMQVCVDSQTVAEVISGWTGIPVGKMMTDEIRMISQLQETLAKRIIGQSHALEAISKRVQTARANLVDPRRPIGVFMMVGPSGVGKTETALALADAMYGGERNLVTINMSEYQEPHTVSGLKGSPPGYIGYGEGGVLTEAVRRKPYCVLLLDEIEKAHQDVQELFYQVFDKGQLEDAEGRVIDFKNTIILLTSNEGTDLITSLCADPETRPDAEHLAEALRPALLKVFKPAFLGRTRLVPYFPLSDDVMEKIIHLQLAKIEKRLRENHQAEFVCEKEVVRQILQRCREAESGARSIDHILTDSVLPAISREILARMASDDSISRVAVSVAKDGEFSYKIN